jgi:hypothetical protein
VFAPARRNLIERVSDSAGVAARNEPCFEDREALATNRARRKHEQTIFARAQDEGTGMIHGLEHCVTRIEDVSQLLNQMAATQ